MKKIVRILICLTIGLLSFQIGLTLYENVSINQEIKKFKDKAILNESISTDKIKYYEVSRETYFPDEFEKGAFFDDDFLLPGAEGDIFVTQQAPFPYLPGIYQFVSFFFGGHAAYIGSNNDAYQTNGYLDSDEYLFKAIFKGGRKTHVHTIENYWLDPFFHDEKDQNYKKFGSYYRKEWIGLRVKGVTQEEIDSVTNIMKQLEQNKAQYNFLFTPFSKNKYYCTDLISKPFSTITKSNGSPKYNLNMDGFAVTVKDLIKSKDTYISFYVTTDRNDVKHIYYIN